ncbi:MAG: hypothetical protein CMK59_04965 [Proteobacteria bacterium]|nr:hypothetical protein [Pseudomonadota bacterium]
MSSHLSHFTTNAYERYWTPVTVRTAWEMSAAGVENHSELLHAAREHVLCSLPDELPIPVVERLTTLYVFEFLDRYDNDRYQKIELDPDLYMEIPYEWRLRILEDLKKSEHVLFHFFYADGHSLKQISKKSNIPLNVLEKSKSSLLKKMSVILEEDQQSLDLWEQPRIDRILGFLANLSASDHLQGISFVPEDLLRADKKKKIRSCPRMSKAYRLLKNGWISIEDLKYEGSQLSVAPPRQEVLALLLHPDARKYRGLLTEQLSPLATPAEEDVWFVSTSHLSDIEDRLQFLAEGGTPPRHYLRGAMVSGICSEIDDVLLGPLPIRLIEAARARQWGVIDGMDPLPPPLPTPPKASLWWVGAVVMFLMSIVSLVWAFKPQEDPPSYPLATEFRVSPHQIWIKFDVSNQAYLSVVAFSGSNFQIIDADLFHEKGKYAATDGSFFYSTTPLTDQKLWKKRLKQRQMERFQPLKQGKANSDGTLNEGDALDWEPQNVILISSEQPIPELERIVSESEEQLDSLDAFERQLHLLYPHADVVISPTYLPPIMTRIQHFWGA